MNLEKALDEVVGIDPEPDEGKIVFSHVGEYVVLDSIMTDRFFVITMADKPALQEIEPAPRRLRHYESAYPGVPSSKHKRRKS